MRRLDSSPLQNFIMDDEPPGGFLRDSLAGGRHWRLLNDIKDKSSPPRHSINISEPIKRDAAPGFAYSEKSYQLSDGGQLYSVFSPVQSRRSNSRPSFLSGTQQAAATTSPVTQRARANNRRFKLKFHHHDVPPSYRNRSATPPSQERVKTDTFSAGTNFSKTSDSAGSHFSKTSEESTSFPNFRERFSDSSAQSSFESSNSSRRHHYQSQSSTETTSGFDERSSTSSNMDRDSAFSKNSSRSSRDSFCSDSSFWDSAFGSSDSKWRSNREVPSPFSDSFSDIDAKLKQFDASLSSDEDEPVNLCLADELKQKMKKLKNRIKIKTEPLEDEAFRRKWSSPTRNSEGSSIFDSFYERRKKRDRVGGFSDEDLFETDFNKLKQKTLEKFDKLKQEAYGSLFDQEEAMDLSKDSDRSAYTSHRREETKKPESPNEPKPKSKRFPYISDMLDNMTLQDEEKLLKPFWERHEDLERKLREWCRDESPNPQPPTSTCSDKKPPRSMDSKLEPTATSQEQTRSRLGKERKSPKLVIPEINVEKQQQPTVESPKASDIYIGNVQLPYNYLFVPEGGYQQNLGLHPMFDIGRQSWGSVSNCDVKKDLLNDPRIEQLGDSLKRSHSCDDAVLSNQREKVRGIPPTSTITSSSDATEVKKSASDSGTSQGMFHMAKPRSVSTCDNDISICKFKLIRGAQPSLEQKKSFYVPSARGKKDQGEMPEGFLPGPSIDRKLIPVIPQPLGMPMPMPIPTAIQANEPYRKYKFHLGLHEEMGRKMSPANKRLRRRSQKALMREKLEATFREQGFLIKTQQVSSAEGAVYCKFRQLKKFTRYLFKSWKDYLPKDIEAINNSQNAATPSVGPQSPPPMYLPPLPPPANPDS